MTLYAPERRDVGIHCRLVEDWCLQLESSLAFQLGNSLTKPPNCLVGLLCRIHIGHQNNKKTTLVLHVDSVQQQQVLVLPNNVLASTNSGLLTAFDCAVSSHEFYVSSSSTNIMSRPRCVTFLAYSA